MSGGFLRYAGGCRIYPSELLGHRCVVLENRWLRTNILVDRGAAIFDLVWKSDDVDLLWRWERGLRPPGYIPGLALAGGSFQDHFFGGWDLMFPTVDRHEPARPVPTGYHGEVAQQPWEWAVERDGADEIVLRASMRCVRNPFRIERRFRMGADAAALELETTWVNVGSVPARYAIGEHIALRLDHLGDHDMQLDLPGGTLQTPPGSDGEGALLAAGQSTPWPLARAADGGQLDLRRIPTADASTSDVLAIVDLPEGRATLRPAETAGAPTMTLSWSLEAMPALLLWLARGGDTGAPWFGTARLLAIEPMSLLPWDDENRLPTLAAGERAACRLELSVGAA